MTEQLLICVDLIYALEHKQQLEALKVKPGTKLGEAINQSGILPRYPEIDLALNKVGIFSKVTPLDATLRSGDRIEIYRPLKADPKEIRKRKALKK